MTYTRLLKRSCFSSFKFIVYFRFASVIVNETFFSPADLKFVAVLPKAMNLFFFFVAICLAPACAAEYQCPSRAHMQVCKCAKSSVGLEISCENALMDKVGEDLANVSDTKQFIYYLTLKDVRMTNLKADLMVGLQVENIVVLNCSLFTIDDDAFIHAAAAIHSLILPYNSLEWVPSKALEKLSSLTYLNLKFNRLEFLHAEAFKGLHSLIRLSLHGNRIKYIDSSAFVGIGSKFEDLGLDGNELTAVPSVALRNLSSLKFLELQNNKIALLQPGEFASMANGNLLSQLILANNTIRRLPPKAFVALAQLEILDLSANAVESIHPFAFHGIEEKLLLLKLGDNLLEDIPSESLTNMSQLNTLDLRRNNICKLRNDDFLSYGKSLTDIYLQGNTLTYIDPESFASLNSLKLLCLHSNRLTTAPYETYEPFFGKLETFDIYDNPLHCDCNISWLADWMNNRSRSSIVKMVDQTKCASPEQHLGVPLIEIPEDQLICENTTSKLPDTCCNCIINSSRSLYCSTFMTILQLSFMFFIIVLPSSSLL